MPAALTHALAGLVAGAGTWTFLEYVIHAWLGHLPRGKTHVSAEHLAHHRDILYFVPLATKLAGAVPVLSIATGLAYAAMDLTFALSFLLALTAGWWSYEWLHQEIHVRAPKGRYALWATRHHLAHHFTHPAKNHGVTTPLWDFVFGTYVRVDKVRVPPAQRARIPWLANGAVPDFIELGESR